MQLVGSWVPTSHKPPTVTSGRTKQPQLFSTGGNTSTSSQAKLAASPCCIMHVVMYHWLEVPQVSFVATKAGLPRQNLSTLSRKIFLSRQTCKFCHDKHTFVATKDVFCRDKRRVCRDKRRVCRDKHNFVGKGFVATKICLCGTLSREAYFCRDKRRALSRQKTCSVSAQMILVAAPACDSYVRACMHIIYVCILLITILLASLVMSQ